MNENWDFWKWALGVVVAAFLWVGSLLYATGRATKEIERNDADFDRRLKALETCRKEQAAMCERRKAELIAELQREICNIVRLAIKDVIIDHNKELGAIGTNVALHGQVLDQIQVEVAAIFDRLNRHSKDRDEQQGDRRR